MYSAITLTHYGSLEIKRAYRKNMAIGIITGALIMIASISSYRLFANLHAAEISIVRAPAPDSVILLPPPLPPIYDDFKSTRIAIERPIPKSGIPTPVPEADAPENATLPTVDDLITLISKNMPKSIDDLNPNSVLIANPEEIIPDPSVFIPVDEMPQAIESIVPVYPEMARIAGVQGEVWGKAYIDKNGKVREVIIFKPSGANAGFEESAIAAARQTEWKPAISNGRPVGVWVSYKIEFRLR